MQFKRIIRMALASVMAVSLLTACGEDASSTASSDTTEVTTESTDSDTAAAEASVTVSSNADLSTRKVGISIYQYSDAFMSLYRAELVDYLESLGFTADNITVADAANDQATQTNQITNFISDEVDVLIVNPVEIGAAENITDMAVSAGIPLIYINREPVDTEETRWADNHWDVTYVGCDAAVSGTLQGEIIAALDNHGDLNGDGKVSYYLIEGDGENTDAAIRSEYSVQAIEAAGVTTECLGNAAADWERAEARDIAEAALEEHGENIEVMICNNDAMALGALEAIQAAGRTVNKDIYLVGVDALKEACEDIIAGTMTGTVYNDYVGQSHAAADAAVSYITGVGNEYSIRTDYLKVTAQNAQDVLDSLQ